MLIKNETWPHPFFSLEQIRRVSEKDPELAELLEQLRDQEVRDAADREQLDKEREKK